MNFTILCHKTAYFIYCRRIPVPVDYSTENIYHLDTSMGLSKSFKNTSVPLQEMFDNKTYSTTYVPPEPTHDPSIKSKRSSSKLTSSLKKRTVSTESLLLDTEGELMEDDPHDLFDEMPTSQLELPAIPPRNPNVQNS